MPTETWTVDSDYSTAQFEVRRVGKGNIAGVFRSWGGRILLAADLRDSRVELWFSTDSIDTHDRGRDIEIKSAKLMDAESFPLVTFSSTDCEIVDSYNIVVRGQLRIKDRIREACAAVRFMGEVTDADGETRMGFECTAEVNPEDFGIVRHPGLEPASRLIVGESLGATFFIEAVREAAACEQDADAPAPEPTRSNHG